MRPTAARSVQRAARSMKEYEARREAAALNGRVQYALVRSTSPEINAELADSRIMLQADDLVFGQWASTTQPDLRIGDALVVSKLEGGDWVVLDVVTEAEASPSVGGHTIQDEGVDLPRRTKLDFVGANVTATDNAGTDQTIVTITAPSGDNFFTHTQTVASAVWTVTHNLGKFPSVTVVDSGGSEVLGDVTYLNSNSLEIDFTASFSGKAYCN